MAGERILVVEDDADIREVVRLSLSTEGFDVHLAFDGRSAVELAPQLKPDLIILDILLPYMDGMEVCQQIRRHSDTPIIFLSCKGEDQDKIVGLSIGGDDYLTKPFSLGELLARVKVQLRHRQRNAQTTETSLEDILSFPGLTINQRTHTVTIDGKPVELTAKEFEILVLLATNPNAVFSAEHIFRSVWGTDSHGDNRTTMVHLSNLRKKIEPDPANPRYVQTLKGVGYRFKLSKQR